jgi:hypothetical protein
MLFFKRILKETRPESKTVLGTERRGLKRYAINPLFPIKAVLCYSGRTNSQDPMGPARPGWHWQGRLLDCSERGARIQMSPAHKVEARSLCDLRLTVEEFKLTVPCHITNIREHAEGLVFGLRQDIADEATGKAFRQLIEVLALGSTLALHSKTKERDKTGYLVEHYVSNRPARLSIWRHPADESVAAFEFQLRDNLVRAAEGHALQYLVGAPARTATPAQAQEIQRLFNWVLPNLAAAVPKDVREFLLRYST